MRFRVFSMYTRLALIAAFLFAAFSPMMGSIQQANAAGSISLTALGTAYTQDFNSLATSGTDNVISINGWDLTESGGGARDNEQYAADNGGSNTGDTYSYGSDSDRALGGLQSGTLIPTFGASFTNNTGGTIESLTISYRGEHWRRGATGRTDQIDFQYSLNAASLTTGTYTDVNELDFVSATGTSTGALDGNTVGEDKSHTITGLSIANGASFWIRWTDANASGADDGLAVDNFSLTPQGTGGGETAPSVTNTSPANSATNVAVNSDVVVTFSESVNFATNSFTFTCDSNPVAFSLSSSPATSATLNPDADLPADATCSVTVVAANISDVDTDDPPDNMAADYPFSFDTVSAQVCGTVDTPIGQVQGPGATTPLSGTVTVEGIVTRRFQTSTTSGGIFVQDAGDGNPNTSDGIAVFVGSAYTTYNLGDRVEVTGTVSEFTTTGASETQISSATITVCSTGNTLPAATPITLPMPTDSATYLEQFEGMLLSVPYSLTVSEVYTLGRFADFTATLNGRFIQFTQTNSPSTSGFAADNALKDRTRIQVDDGSYVQNPDPVIFPSGNLSFNNTVRVGYTVSNIQGVLGHRYSGSSSSPNTYRLHATSTPVFGSASNPRTAAPAAVNQLGTPNVKVGSFNVLNYFNGNGTGGGFPTSRGASSAAEFTRQRDKIINAINALGADVVGLIEIENDATPNSAIEDLVNGLNNGSSTWSFINTGVIGTDEIRLALIYKPSVVTPSGSPMVDNDSINNRPTLAHAFIVNSSGGKFTVVVNHFKSKGCDGASGLDTDQLDGQGCFNARRNQQAQRLLTFLNSTVIPTAGDNDVLIIGDLNSYAKEDPITTLKNGGLVNELDRLIGDATAYSYVFQGQSGTLDYALTTPSLSSQVTGVTEWHINPDEPIALDYNLEFKSVGQQTSFYGTEPYRSSDHDPVLIGLNIAGAPANVADTIGVFRDISTVGHFLLRNSNTGGIADFIIPFGLGTDQPVVGDWNGDGVDTVGLYRQSAGLFILSNSNAPASADLFIPYGGPGDVAVVGDWDGNGTDTIAIYRTGVFMIRNTNNGGFPDTYIQFGDSSLDRPLSGDWNNNGTDTPGVWRASAATFYLTNQSTNGAAPVDFTINYGTSADVGFVGDWDADGVDSLGVYRPSNGDVYLKNALTDGLPDILFNYGIAQDQPLAGVWQASGPDNGSAPIFVPKQ